MHDMQQLYQGCGGFDCCRAECIMHCKSATNLWPLVLVVHSSSSTEDIEKEACFILGLLAVKPEYQSRIAQLGALEGLVRLLREHRLSSTTKSQPGSGGAARRAADAITNLAHENVDIKNKVCVCVYVWLYRCMVVCVYHLCI